MSPATYHPDTTWAQQQARNAQMWLLENGLEFAHLIHDRDAKFPIAFNTVFESVGVHVIKTPIMAPNANAYAESWIATLKKECLRWFVCFSLKHMDHIVQTFVGYYNEHRPHQSKGNRVLTFPGEFPLRLTGANSPPLGQVVCTKSLGGLLKHYRRAA